MTGGVTSQLWTDTPESGVTAATASGLLGVTGTGDVDVASWFVFVFSWEKEEKEFDRP